MGFKKGWKAYRAAHSYTTHKTMGTEGGKRGKRRPKVKHAFIFGGDMGSPGLIQRPVKKLSSITPGKVFSPLVDLLLIIAGMGIGAGIKKVSPVKNPHLMNAGGGVIGIGGSLMARNRFIKLPLIGIALQSAISEVKVLFPKMPLPIAGDDEIVYLPVQGEDEETAQIEMQGEAERVAGNAERVEGEDERVAEEDDNMGEEGRNS